jgi:polygalacturonase
LRQISDQGGRDGIDIVGSRGVRVHDCFLRNGDDNIAVKALDVRRFASGCQDSPGDFDGDWTGPVHDILVEDCAFYNDCGGCAMEIGYETRTDSMADITFRNIDVMAVHQFGSVFGIHNGDRARVENVRWENIRVKHHYDKLIDFRVLHSRWNRDAERGTIRNISLKNIRVQESVYNEGYSVSLIGDSTPRMR